MTLVERIRDGHAQALTEEEQARLGEQLDAIVEQARRDWPGVSLAPEYFIDHLRERLDPQAPVGPTLERLATSDLYLACACARGHAPAIAAFERAFDRDLDRVLSRSGRARGIDADDLRQHLRERLFVERDGRPARIGSYTGEGSLRAWVRVAATRLRIDIERRRWDLQTGLDTRRSAGLADAAHSDLELAFMESRYRKVFARAFEEAAQALTPRQRNLLRLNVVHKVSGTKIAATYGVHRATAKRWLASAREALLTGTRERVREALGLGAEELQSLMGKLDGDLELSVARVLGTGEVELPTG